MAESIRLGWLTNCWVDEAQKTARDLILGHKVRVIMIGNPKPTEAYTKEELIDMGVVGLYECDPSQADQMRGFQNIFVTPR